MGLTQKLLVGSQAPVVTPVETKLLCICSPGIVRQSELQETMLDSALGQFLGSVKGSKSLEQPSNNTVTGEVKA